MLHNNTENMQAKLLGIGTRFTVMPNPTIQPAGLNRAGGHKMKWSDTEAAKWHLSSHPVNLIQTLRQSIKYTDILFIVIYNICSTIRIMTVQLKFSPRQMCRLLGLT